MKTKKTKLMKQADRLWFIKLFTGVCEVCGQPSNQVHHYYYKGSFAHLRYDLENGINICQVCHYIIHFKDNKFINEDIIEKRGKEWYNKLTAKAKVRPSSSFKTVAYYHKIIEYLNNEISKGT